jgi:hypothetical protein
MGSNSFGRVRVGTSKGAAVQEYISQMLIERWSNFGGFLEALERGC